MRALRYSQQVMRCGVLPAAVLCLAAIWTTDAAAQGRRPPDPKEWVPKLDTNGNGQIEPEELAKSPGRSFIEPALTRAGVDTKKPIPVDKLIETMSAGRSGSGSSGGGERRDGERRDERNRDSSGRDGGGREERGPASSSGSSGALNPPSSAPKTTSAVPGFGQTDQGSKSSGFGASTTGSASQGTKGFGSGSSGDTFVEREKIRGFARSLVTQHDENGNGVLDEDEWGALKADQKLADSDGDKKITVEELSAKLANFGTSSGTPSGSTPSAASPASPGSSAGSTPRPSESRPGDGRLEVRSNDGRSGDGRGRSGSSSSKGSSSDKKGPMSTRLLSPMERLPKGLPDWFLKCDANEDGQVSMAEYATAWSESKAAEFGKYDLDGDGFVTPKEALKPEKK